MAVAEPLRIATYAAPLSRDGPGLLLRDLVKGEDAQIAAIAAVIVQAAPDVLLLTDFDYDLDGLALRAFSDMLAARGLTYPYVFAARPNSGWSTGRDMDGNGRTGEARDAQGYGRFSGDGGMAVLSRWPIDTAAVTDLSGLLWRDMPGAVLPGEEGAPFPDAAVYAVQRLSDTAHWIVPGKPDHGAAFDLLAWSATPPVFDGPEDRNGLRNRDELRLWENVIAQGRERSFFVVGNANLDPFDGEGLSAAMAQFLINPAIQDPAPQSQGAAGFTDAAQVGPAQNDTASWPQDGPGNLRVSYVLPSADWRVTGAGVFWPAQDDPLAAILGADGLAAGPHHLVWVDVAHPPAP